MADRLGRPPRVKDLSRFTSDGRFDVDSPKWLPHDGDDPSQVAVARLQHRILRAVAEAAGPDHRTETVALILGLDRRHVPALLAGTRALDTEQLLALMLGLDLGPADLADGDDPTARGGAALLPPAHRGWLRRDAAPGRALLRRPDPRADWPEVARSLARARETDPGLHLQDSGSLLLRTVQALADHGGPAPALADRLPATHGALVAYRGRHRHRVEAHLLTGQPDGPTVAAAVHGLLDDTDDPTVTVMALSRYGEARLGSLCPPLAALREGDAVVLQEADVHRLGLSVEPGRTVDVPVLCLARAAGRDETLLVLASGKEPAVG